jgi:hypothetical protein
MMKREKKEETVETVSEVGGTSRTPALKSGVKD